MKKSKTRSLYNNFHFLVLYSVLLVFSLHNWYYVFALIPYFIYTILKSDFLIYELCLTVIICFIYFLKPNEIEYEFNCLIIDKIDNNYEAITQGEHVLLSFKDEIEVGSFVYVKTQKKELAPSPFNYLEYLKNKRINYYLEVKKYEITGIYLLPPTIKGLFLNNLDDSKTKTYISTLLFADNILDKEIKDDTKKLGLSHIFVMSGMHISILFILFSFILNTLFRYDKWKNIFSIIFLSMMIIITNFSISVMRSSLLVLLPIICKKKHPLLTKLDYLSIIALLFILYNPRIIFLPQFYLSFESSFLLIMLEKDNKLMMVFKSSFLLFFINIPFIINLNYEINFIAILIAPFYLLIFEFLLFPLTILCFFLYQFIYKYTDYIYSLLEYSIEELSNIDYFVLHIGHLHDLCVIVMMVIMFIFLITKDKSLKFILLSFYLSFLGLVYIKPFYIYRYQLVMYNVGQGDSLLFKDNKTNTNILIDAYGNILKYLQYDGINNLNYIFLSHGDNDHLASFEKVYDYYKPKYLFTSKYSNTDKMNELKSNYNFNLLKFNNSFYINEIIVDVIGPIKEFSEENNNSLVMFFYFDIHNILFTGDAEKDEEEAIISQYRKLNNVEVLKASHHGSSTSSNDFFLNIINPQYVLISVGKNNKYGLPNNSNLLDNFNVFRTDLLGSIYVSFKEDGLKIKNV